MARSLFSAADRRALRGLVNAATTAPDGTPEATVTLRTVIGVDSANQPRYGPAITHAAFVTFGSEEVAGANGERVLARGSALLAMPAPAVTPDMALSVDGVAYDIVAVSGGAGGAEAFIPVTIKFA